MILPNSGGFGGTTEAAPAKLNLALHVTGRRADGYHLLDTLAVFTEAGDRVTAAPAQEDRFSVTGPFAAALPFDGSNLVLRARNAFFEKFGGRIPLAIILEKHLPVSSGIGGGSSDAAAVLRLLARQFRPAVDIEALAKLALPLGADVPMCLFAQPLRAQGVGEEITPVEGLPVLSVLLVNPGIGVSTPAIFKALQEKANPPCLPLPPAADFSAVCDWLRQTRNDLQAPAITLAPAIAETIQALHAAGAAFARMSGSGATCFGLFPTLAQAERAGEAIRRTEPSWWVCPTCTLPS